MTETTETTEPRRRRVRLIRQSFPDPAALDTAVSRAILVGVSDGRLPETLRLHPPGPVVAFGPKDRLSPGFADAVRVAAEHGFASIHRLAGGRAAVFHEGTIAFSWVVPDESPRTGITRRFERIARMMADAFRSLGVDARVGEVLGEYCPGAHSVNARGAVKVMGVGQRLVVRAAHTGGVVVVSGDDRIRDVLVPVYRALGLEWDPSTAGSLAGEVPGITWEDAERAIVERFAADLDLEEGELDAGTLRLARTLEPQHAVVEPAAAG